MPHAFAQIAFTPQVKAEQQRDGSRAGYARSFEADAQTFKRVVQRTAVVFGGHIERRGIAVQVGATHRGQ